jgi:hypothetical protein
MVSASTASTAQATNTVRISGSAVTGLLPGLLLEYKGDGVAEIHAVGVLGESGNVSRSCLRRAK